MPKNKLFEDLSKSQKNKRLRQFMTESKNSSDESTGYTCDSNESNSCFVSSFKDEVDDDMNSGTSYNSDDGNEINDSDNSDNSDDSETKPKLQNNVSSSSSESQESNSNDLPPPPDDYVLKKDEPKTLKKLVSSYHDETAGQCEIKSNDKNNNDNLLTTAPHYSPQRSIRFHETEDSINDYDHSDTRSSCPIDAGDKIGNRSPNFSKENKGSAKPTIRSIIKTQLPLKVSTANASQLVKNTEELLSPLASHTTHLKSQVREFSLQNSNDENCHGHDCCHKLMSEMKSIKTMVSSIYLTLSNKNDMVDEAEQKTDFGFPIQTEKQLIAFESKLKNAIDASQYQMMVKKIGGTSFEKHVRNALVLTLSDVMAYRMSWTGAKSTIMVQKLRFIKLITDSVTQKWSVADDKKIEAVIKSWLQHAGDRLKK